MKQSLLGYVGGGAQEEGKGKHSDSVICVGIDILNSVSIEKDCNCSMSYLLEEIIPFVSGILILVFFNSVFN